MGSHWYAVPGFGTSGFTLPTIRPIRPLGRACLSGVTEQVRARAAGDTLVCLSGRMDASDLGMLMSLRSGYPTILAALFGPQEQLMSSETGMRVITVDDAAEFARMWDEVWAHP